ncbi:MAG TPA: CHAD domain-containing protein [Blastocatellia bacterium]
MAKPLKIRKISPDDRLDNAAARILRTRIKEFYSRWPDPDSIPTPEQLHDLRISGKRLRYSAESLRELYPDRLTFLIDLLKIVQDQLGEIQDCVTQRGMIEASLARIRGRNSEDDRIPALEKIISEYDRRQSTLFTHFHETWRAMAMEEFRESLKAMVSRIASPQKERADASEDHETRGPVLRVVAGHEAPAGQAAEESFPVDQAGDETGAEAVVDVDHGDVRGAGVEHSE